MSTETNELEALHNRILAIDKQIGDLTTEKFLAGVRHAILCKKLAGAPPPPTPRGSTRFYDDAFGGLGFEEKNA